jgi:hypothetical protein
VIPGPAGEAAGEILSVLPIRNLVGEINGVILRFARSRPELTSEDSLSWDDPQGTRMATIARLNPRRRGVVEVVRPT